MKATLRHIYLCRTANTSWRTCVVVKQIQSNPIQYWVPFRDYITGSGTLVYDAFDSHLGQLDIGDGNIKEKVLIPIVDFMLHTDGQNIRIKITTSLRYSAKCSINNLYLIYTMQYCLVITWWSGHRTIVFAEYFAMFLWQFSPKCGLSTYISFIEYVQNYHSCNLFSFHVYFHFI